MAQRDYTISLKQASFPMLSEQQERTVIGGSDKSSSGDPESPGVGYCHNVMPTSKGLDSVGYLQIVPPYSPVTTLFSDVRIIYGSNRTRLYLGFSSDGSIHVLKEGSTFWFKLSETFSVDVNQITIGTVNGVSYIYYKSIGCVKYNESTDALDTVVLTGLVASEIVGITASYGYLIAYTESDIAWSSTVDPTDFTPSAVTGAGGGSVAGIGGAILFCLPNSLGTLIYTETNTIAGTYTGNVKYPFKYREVDNSKGGISLDFTAYEANSAAQFVYSKAGLQSLTSQKAEIILPEITDFLAGKKFEDFDETTKTFIVTELTTTMKKKIKFIASRYLVISYGIFSFTHALIYDIGLKRLGKLKIAHVDCFEYVGSQKEVSKESIAFLLATGEVSVLNFSTTVESNGIVIFGKLQYTRNKIIVLQGIEVENIDSDAALSVFAQQSLDGKTISSTIAGNELTSVNKLRKYGFRLSAVNHSILLIGKFNLTTLFIIYTLGGRR